MAEDTKYADRMAEKLREWERDIRQLRAKAEETGADKTQEVREELSELESRREEARTAWERAKESTGEASRELWRGFEDACRELSRAWERAVSRL